MKLSRDQFDQYVEEAMESLPEDIRDYLDEISVAVEDVPSDNILQKMNIAHPLNLLGLFQGIPRHHHKAGHPVTSQITLYRQSIQKRCRTRNQLRRQIYKTLIHELGHYLGFNEAQIRHYLP